MPAVTIAQKLKNLYDRLVVSLGIANQFVEALPDCYDAVEEKGGTLPAQQTATNLPSAIASIPSGISTDGFVGNPVIGDLTNLADIFVYCNAKEIHSAAPAMNVKYFQGQNTGLTIIELTEATYAGTGFYGQSSLLYAILPKVVSVGDGNFFRSCSNLLEVDMRSLQTYSRTRFFDGCSKLEKANLLNLSSIYSGSYEFSNCVNLIDLIIGAGMTNSFSLDTWSPTNALNASSSSLVKTGETFANNLEKFLYNIREHMAANLDQSIMGKTITFSSAVYNAIHADSTTENAFGVWSIASA